MTKDNLWCIVLGFMIFSILNSLPFSDASKYRDAIQHCEKSLPRDQHCVVLGIAVDTN